MASKFQNRLVGTVILVALGVIVLPALLDGNKKHYEDEFAAIPLVPKPGDSSEAESLPSLNQTLPSQPPEGAQDAMQEQSAQARDMTPSAQAEPERAAPPAATPPAAIAPPVVVARPTAPVKPEVKPEVKPKPKPETKPQAKPKPEPRPEPKTEVTPEPKAEVKAETPPAGQAFVVQLGALKNADKVNEIVAKLRLSGYRAYTVPAAPVQGQITRIYVGPDASRQKLQASLGELQQLSGLSGQVRTYSAR